MVDRPFHMNCLKVPTLTRRPRRSRPTTRVIVMLRSRKQDDGCPMGRLRRLSVFAGATLALTPPPSHIETRLGSPGSHTGSRAAKARVGESQFRPDIEVGIASLLSISVGYLELVETAREACASLIWHSPFVAPLRRGRPRPHVFRRATACAQD